MAAVPGALVTCRLRRHIVRPVDEYVAHERSTEVDKLRIGAALAVFLSAVLVATAVPSFAQGPSTESVQDAVAAIRHVGEVLGDDWDKVDLDEWVTVDFDFVTSNAMWWRGRKELSAGIALVAPSLRAQRAQTVPNVQMRIEKVRFMTSDVAVVHRGGGSGEPRATNVFVREDGRWLMLAQIGTRAAAAPGFELPGIRSLPAEQATIVSSWPAQNESGESRAQAETAIRGLVAAAEDAFNAKDAAAYAALFVGDADFVTANAYWWRGREEIEE